MAQIHANERPVRLSVNPEIWGDMKSIVIDREINGHAIDSMTISSESEADEFVEALLAAMNALNWNQ